VNATWSVPIERLLTQLPVRVHADELAPQAIWVTLRLRGVARACRAMLGKCIDYEPLYRWITKEWPRTPHTPLLETRINELIAFTFDLDDRLREVQVELAKQCMSAGAVSAGIERCVLRSKFDAKRCERNGDVRVPA
jgi:dihydroneopterin aldolase